MKAAEKVKDDSLNAIDFEIAKAKSANILEMKAAEKENKQVKDDSHKAAKAAIRSFVTKSMFLKT
jgi:hypothetical protein